MDKMEDELLIITREGVKWLLVSETYFDVLDKDVVGDDLSIERTMKELEKRNIPYLYIKSTKERPYVAKEFRGGR